jgi:hypothetical protein
MSHDEQEIDLLEFLRGVAISRRKTARAMLYAYGTGAVSGTADDVDFWEAELVAAEQEVQRLKDQSSS